ncbi:hypothetical protein [Paracoccus sp. Ld10]
MVQVNRDVPAERPDQEWLADFTDIQTAKIWLHVTVVLTGLPAARQGGP